MSVSVTLVRAVLEEIARVGIDPERLLAEVEFDRALIEDAGARIPEARYDALHQRALDLTGDPALGLHMAEHARIGAFHIVAILSAHCRTLREALTVFRRFRHLLSEVEPPSLEEDGDHAVITCHFVAASPRGDRRRAEFGITALVRFAQQSIGTVGAPRAIDFTHAAPPYADEYARLLACPVRFGALAHRIHLDRAALDRPQIHSNAHLYRVLETSAASDLASLSGPTIAARVRAAIVAHHDGGRPSMDEVARRLGLSGRSLRRRLHDEAASFADLVDDALAELARRQLQDPRATIEDVALRLGFSEPSAFHRAFKRWTGLTPGQYRSLPP